MWIVQIRSGFGYPYTSVAVASTTCAGTVPARLFVGACRVDLDDLLVVTASIHFRADRAVWLEALSTELKLLIGAGRRRQLRCEAD